MMAKIQDGTVVQYPYSISRLRQDNPQTSFPNKMPESALAEWGVVIVDQPDAPAYDGRTQRLSLSDAPSFVANSWTLVWEIVEKTSEEVSYYDKLVGDNARSKRDTLIAGTDWMALSDNTLTAEWATHRQALRDITDHANFPYLGEDDWPVEPA